MYRNKKRSRIARQEKIPLSGDAAAFFMNLFFIHDNEKPAQRTFHYFCR